MKPAQFGVSQAVSDRAEMLQAAFSENYVRYQYRFVEFFIEHLADLNAVFKGDLQKAIVLALIGQVTLKALRDANSTGEPVAAIPQEQFLIAASRISDISAIPRETVRRKLAALEREGWAMRGSTGYWRLDFTRNGRQVREDFAAIDERAKARVARLVADLERFV